jgi:hypothetical protein
LRDQQVSHLLGWHVTAQCYRPAIRRVDNRIATRAVIAKLNATIAIGIQTRYSGTKALHCRLIALGIVSALSKTGIAQIIHCGLQRLCLLTIPSPRRLKMYTRRWEIGG